MTIFFLWPSKMLIFKIRNFFSSSPRFSFLNQSNSKFRLTFHFSLVIFFQGLVFIYRSLSLILGGRGHGTSVFEGQEEQHREEEAGPHF